MQNSDDGLSQGSVERPGWTTWVLVTWIVATAALYYYNFTGAFFEANEGSIRSLLGF